MVLLPRNELKTVMPIIWHFLTSRPLGADVFSTMAGGLSSFLQEPASIATAKHPAVHTALKELVMA
jgi:hypothetical protein